MEKSKTFYKVRFTPEVIQQAKNVMGECLPKGCKIQHPYCERKIQANDTETWTHDTDAEFFADMRKPYVGMCYDEIVQDFRLRVAYGYDSSTKILVAAPNREQTESIMAVFEASANDCRLPEPPAEPAPPQPSPCVFIGHGHNQQWRDLKDHLHDKHGYDVETYETGARAGHAIRDVLESMADRSSCAFLVTSGEDETADGKIHARQNVVHEIGLFQGRLGFSRAIVLLEDGVEEFSNLQGIEQIRYSKNNIKETFGEVLATLKREFGD